MGADRRRTGELASANLDVACPRRVAFPPESGRTSFHQRVAACAQCGVALSIAHWVDGKNWTELVCRRTVRGASHQRRIGGVGGRAQKRAVHPVLLSDALGLWMVRAETRLGPVRRHGRVVRCRTIFQADGDYTAFRSSSA